MFVVVLAANVTRTESRFPKVAIRSTDTSVGTGCEASMYVFGSPGNRLRSSDVTGSAQPANTARATIVRYFIILTRT